MAGNETLEFQAAPSYSLEPVSLCVGITYEFPDVAFICLCSDGALSALKGRTQGLYLSRAV